MQVTTELRPMFSYSFIYIVFFIVPIILIILINLLMKFFKRKTIHEKVITPDCKDIILIKNNYLLKIQKLLDDFNQNKISNRQAYQALSNIIRTFIYEATNIKVQNYTLKDISQINMPILYELVSEYYNPEFSKISKGNIKESINKTRLVIEKWN